MNFYYKKNKERSIYGFTLIEVIITIAIIGVITVPIALIFQGVLATTITTKEQLVATQLGQQYTETIKAMNMEQVLDLTDAVDSSGMITEELLSLYNLPTIPNKYTVHINLFKKTEDTGFENEFLTDYYKMPDDLPIDSSVSYDVELLLEDATSSDTIVSMYNDEDTIDNHTFDGAEENRKIDIHFAKSGHDRIRVTVDVNDNDPYEVEKSIADYKGIINIICNDLTSTSNQKTTTITVSNSTENDLNIYVYEDKEDKIQPEIVLNYGSNTVYRNISIPKLFEYRLYEFIIQIEKDGKILSEVVTTRLAKE